VGSNRGVMDDRTKGARMKPTPHVGLQCQIIP